MYLSNHLEFHVLYIEIGQPQFQIALNNANMFPGWAELPRTIDNRVVQNAWQMWEPSNTLGAQSWSPVFCGLCDRYLQFFPFSKLSFTVILNSSVPDSCIILPDALLTNAAKKPASLSEIKLPLQRRCSPAEPNPVVKIPATQSPKTTIRSLTFYSSYQQIILLKLKLLDFGWQKGGRNLWYRRQRNRHRLLRRTLQRSEIYVTNYLPWLKTCLANSTAAISLHIQAALPGSYMHLFFW